MVKNLPTNAGDAKEAGLIPRSGRSLEKKVATHSSILAWKIPWTEVPVRLQSMGLQRVRPSLVTEHARFRCHLFHGIFFLLFHHCPIYIFIACCLVSICLFFSCFFHPLWLMSTFIPLWSEKMLKIIFVLLNLLRLVL